MHRAAQRAWPSPTASCRKSWGCAIPSWSAPSWAGRMPPWGQRRRAFPGGGAERGPLATWDGDDYYDFVELRPVSRVVPPRDRILIWPQAEFWVARDVPLRGAPAEDAEGRRRAGRRAGGGVPAPEERGAVPGPRAPHALARLRPGAGAVRRTVRGPGGHVLRSRLRRRAPHPAPAGHRLGHRAPPAQPAGEPRRPLLALPGPIQHAVGRHRGLPGGGHRLRQSVQQRAVLPHHPQRQPLPGPPAAPDGHVPPGGQPGPPGRGGRPRSAGRSPPRSRSAPTPSSASTCGASSPATTTRRPPWPPARCAGRWSRTRPGARPPDP